MLQFNLLHATRAGLVASIQTYGIIPSDSGFFGPAAYFYEDTAEGMMLARAYLDKKIHGWRLPSRQYGVILACNACCADNEFLDGTEPKIFMAINAAAEDERIQAWSDLAGIKLPRQQKKEIVHARMNSARSQVIAFYQEILGIDTKIFRGQLKQEEPCYAVKDADCIARPRYPVSDYYGRTIA